MKKVWILLCLVVLLSACTEKQQTSKPQDVAVKEKPPLFQAIEDRNISMVREIVTTNKEALNQEYEGDTPLIVAVRDSYPGGYLEIIKILVDSGADYTKKTTQDRSPLLSASFFTSVEAIYYFLDKGGINVNDVDSDGNTPMTLFITRAGIPTDLILEVTDRMVKAGADLNIKNKKGDNFFSNLRSVYNENVVKEIEKKFPPK